MIQPNFFTYIFQAVNIEEKSNITNASSAMGYSWSYGYRVCQDMEKLGLIELVFTNKREKEITFTKEFKEIKKNIAKIIEIYAEALKKHARR